MSIAPGLKSLTPLNEHNVNTEINHVKRHDTVRNTTLRNVPRNDEKSARTAFILCASLGIFGAHHFYLRRYFFGVVYLMTFGLFGIGYIIDILRVQSLVDHANSTPDNIKTFDVYVLWFPLGLLGFHHFYMDNYGHGLLYLFTFGIGGIGWLIDFFRIPSMVTSCNVKALHAEEKSVISAYLFALTPFGIFGAHHYYIKQWKWGLFYNLTGGAFGVGYLFDLIRLPLIVARANRRNEGSDIGNAYFDEVFLLWLTFGIFGFHHFYLRSYSWGLFYLCTFGILGFGWIADAFRICNLVEEYNNFYEDYDFEITELNINANGHLANHNRESPRYFDDVFSVSFQSNSRHNSNDISTNHRKDRFEDISDIFTVSSTSSKPVPSKSNMQLSNDFDDIKSIDPRSTNLTVTSKDVDSLPGQNESRNVKTSEHLPMKTLGAAPMRMNHSKNTQIHDRVIFDDLDNIHGLPPLLIHVGNYKMKEDDVVL